MGVVADGSTDPKAVARANRVSVFGLAMVAANLAVLAGAWAGMVGSDGIAAGTLLTTVAFAGAVLWLFGLGWSRGTWVHATLGFLAIFLWLAILVVDGVIYFFSGWPAKC